MKHFTDKWEEANRENLEGLSYIDDGEHKLFYRFTPSKTNPVGAPLFIVLHGHGTKRATRFQKEGWNVLSPVDHFGYEGKGCWWLGENGNFFVRDLLQRLIRQISREYQCENNIYFYGSSMGGYGAILHGTLCNARAVYANVPQIKLLGTIYSERMMKRYFSAIFDDPISEENDLTNFLTNNKRSYPIFYLCENMIERQSLPAKNYLEEHTNYFINKCNAYKYVYHLELLPKAGHDKNYGLNEVIGKFNRFTPPNQFDNYSDQDKYLKIENLSFDKKLWNYKQKSKSLNHIKIDNNILDIDIDLRKENIFYINSNVISLENNSSKHEKLYFSLNTDVHETQISIFIIEYTTLDKKLNSTSYKLKTGENKIFYTIKDNNTKYIKVLFRFFGISRERIKLKELSCYLHSKTVYNYIKTLKLLDQKYYLLTISRNSDSYLFKARNDIKAYNINLPMDWDINPFNDDNWKFQLHALRMIDKELLDYILNNDMSKLTRCIDILLDWKKDIIETKQNLNFNRYDTKDSFAWHDMATGLRALKIAFVLESIVKLGEKSSVYEYVDELLELAKLHIDALNIQKVAPNNHAIYQLHGLLMLLRLFPNTLHDYGAIKERAEEEMLEVFNTQFFSEGIHKENSSRYHYLAVEIFEKILTKEVYPDITEVFSVVKQAQKNCAYMHFPNLESLMTGDSDYQIVTPRKEEHIDTGITHFEESGYTYVYEDNGTPSMLFFDTAFLNRSHRHADFFNVLLYEYGKNILVDAGKYSYQKENPFRQYCISTRAHNTVLIDNQDYRLDRKYFFASRLKIKERHEHYYHLMASNVYAYMKTSHERHIFYRPQEFLLVVDLLRSEEARNFKQIFHLHQDLELSEEGAYLKTEIDADTPMYIQMQSLDIESGRTQSSQSFSKGKGEIEGYRALGHNEIIENYVLINEAQSSHLVLGTMFSFHQKRDVSLICDDLEKIKIVLDQDMKIDDIRIH